MFLEYVVFKSRVVVYLFLYLLVQILVFGSKCQYIERKQFLVGILNMIIGILGDGSIQNVGLVKFLKFQLIGFGSKILFLKRGLVIVK